MKSTKIRLYMLLSALLALLMCLSLTACGGDEQTESDAVDVPVGENGVSVGDTVTLGSYYLTSDDSKEALTWKVLLVEQGRALLTTTECIDYKPFDDSEYVVGETYNWAYSTLRYWLNGEFYDTVFTDEEKAQIINGGSQNRVAITTPANPMTDLGACEDTYDKIFLLDAAEAEALFADDAARSVGASAYAVEKGVRVNDGKAAWWLRTMGEDANRTAVVLHDGSVSLAGYNMAFGSAGVRPCIWVDMETAYTDADPIVTFADAEVGSRVVFGVYEQDGNTDNGSEDIVWQVLEVGDDRLMLMAEDCLDMSKYYAALSDVTWSTSTLRKWLNGDFFGDAFSREQQALIFNTNVVTEDNPKTGVSGGNATEDKVFVLSIEEVLRYLPKQEDRTAEATRYAESEGVLTDVNFGTAGYWTRNAGEDARHAAYVLYYGDISYEGTQVRADYIGVRPVIWVKK